MLTTEQAARILNDALAAAIREHDDAREKAAFEFDLAVAKLRRIRGDADAAASNAYKAASDAAWSAYAEAAAEEAAEIAAWTAASHYEKADR